MTDLEATGRALRPLWLLTGGALIGALFAVVPLRTPAPWAAHLLIILGAAATMTALFRGPQRTVVLWAMAGLALAGGRGLGAAAERAELQRLMNEPGTDVRVRMVVQDGWSKSRWGWRSQLTVLQANARGNPVSLPRRCRVEVRGGAQKTELPQPGRVVRAIARPSGDPRRPFLVVPSPRLLDGTGEVRLVPMLRNRLAASLLVAGGTDPSRIRAAEIASALALGRRDLVPRERQLHWRRSGFAHLLAVSGLHVGVVGGAIFLLVSLAGAGPRLTRLTTLVAIPAYAVLAGGSPSATRAALMGVIFLGARLAGRAVLPMGAVLLAATGLVVMEPSVVADVGFQLTVLITAALVRWVPPLAERMPGPTWLAGAVAVPIVAQAAAAPLIAAHFRRVIPGALLANLVALPLLAPAVMLAVTAAALAPLSPACAAVCLDLLHWVASILSAVGAVGRAVELVTPSAPVIVLALLAIVGWWALQPRRSARVAAGAWVAVSLFLVVRVFAGPEARPPMVAALPVFDGAAVLLAVDHTVVLFDAGRHPDRVAELLADANVRRISTVIASHTDEDHIGGMARVLQVMPVDRVVVPRWMAASAAAVPLLRAARTASVPVRRVAAGMSLRDHGLAIDVVWPPAEDPPAHENERSLVLRAVYRSGSVVATADIGRRTERRLASRGRLTADILVVPHHGSRDATSAALLDAVSPTIALIPAAPGNTHGHPHAEVLGRLRARHILVRTPSRERACGAVWNGTSWVVFP